MTGIVPAHLRGRYRIGRSHHGVPSAEYGDLNSGMVKIHTKKGKTPWNVLLSINPRTEQVSFSKGLDLGNDKGIVNISGEWTKATQKLNSPYTSYTRRGFLRKLQQYVPESAPIRHRADR